MGDQNADLTVDVMVEIPREPASTGVADLDQLPEYRLSPIENFFDVLQDAGPGIVGLR